MKILRIRCGFEGRRGNALVEFALAFGLLVTIFAGVYRFGYCFYIYNMLESAVRDGARYGSLADYDGGSGNGANFKSRVQDMVVYGNPNPAADAKSLVFGLSIANVTVTPAVDSAGVPYRITVQIDNFTIPDGEKGIFSGFTLKGKPKCTFQYEGRYTVP